MGDVGRGVVSYFDIVSELTREIVRTLATADADGIPKGWWRGNVRYHTFGHKPELRVGFVFELRDEPSPMGKADSPISACCDGSSPRGLFIANWDLLTIGVLSTGHRSLK